MARSSTAPACAAKLGRSRARTTTSTAAMAIDAPMTANRPVSPVRRPVTNNGTAAIAGRTSFVPTVTMPLAATETVAIVVA